MKITITFGAMAEPIDAQVPELSRENADRLQRDAEAITRLHVRGLLTDTETRNSRRRFMKELMEILRREKPAPARRKRPLEKRA